jgi:hypothetical protein
MFKHPARSLDHSVQPQNALMTCALLLRVVVLLGVFCSSLALCAHADDKPSSDTLVFTNGDTLKGKLVSGDGNGVTFNSDMAGSLTIPWAKINTLHSSAKFAVIKKNQKVTRKTPPAEVPQGTIAVADKNLSVETPTGTTTISTSDTAAIVDSPSFEKTVYKEPGILHGYAGSFTLGIAIVESTQKSNTYNGALTLVRTVPNAAWISPRNKTSLDASAIYGLEQQNATLTTPYSSVKTDILHGDLERDEYIKPRFYYLGYASADHNYSQGLALQDIFGGGFGYTVLKNAKQELDVKTDVHYEQQQFVAGAGTPSNNLIGMDFAETYMRKLPKGLVFSETGVITPSFNDGDPYSAAFTGGLTFPVYKRLAFSTGVVDDYISNPAPTFNANSFQFTGGATYTFK